MIKLDAPQDVYFFNKIIMPIDKSELAQLIENTQGLPDFHQNMVLPNLLAKFRAALTAPQITDVETMVIAQELASEIANHNERVVARGIMFSGASIEEYEQRPDTLKKPSDYAGLNATEIIESIRKTLSQQTR